MRIRELKNEGELEAIYPLIKQLNPDMTKAQFTERLHAMRAQGYRCVAACEHNKIIALSGFWVGTRFWCGGYVDIDNIVVAEGLRSKGIGRKLVAWIEKEARRIGCEISVLDSYTTNHASHRFYHREGYKILGYHFVKSL